MEILANNFGEKITNWALQDTQVFCFVFVGRQGARRERAFQGNFTTYAKPVIYKNWLFCNRVIKCEVQSIREKKYQRNCIYSLWEPLTISHGNNRNFRIRNTVFGDGVKNLNIHRA